MAKKNVNIKITADSKEAQKGIDKVTAGLNKINKEAKASSLTKFTKAFSATTASISASVATLKKFTDGLNACYEAYKTQEKAERALSVAAENNPYLDETSVNRLKQFASQLQATSEIGDEVSIRLMSNLAASGRTESEIMKIMGTAADYAAGANISLETAITQLNSAINGNIGQLGKQIPEIKELTKEQLKNGEAVDIIAKKYSGMAESLADAKKQAENLKGDFIENLGAIAQPAMALKENFSINFWKSMAEGAGRFNDYLESISLQARDLAKDAGKINEKGESILKVYTDKDLQLAQAYLENQFKLNAIEKENLILIKEEIRYRERLSADKQKQAEKQAKENKVIDDSAKAREELQKAIEKHTNTEIDTIQKEIDKMHELYESMTADDKELLKGYDEALTKLNDKLEETKEKASNATYSIYSENLSIVKEFATGFQTILGSIADAIENNTERQLENLEQQYKQGVLNEEQYEKKKIQIEKEAAQKTYEIEMAQWTANIVTAAANTALAVSEALAKSGNPYVGIAMAAVMAVAGAAEEAAIIANKPVKPSFETGGIVPGSSWSGDHVQANVNSGEAIFTQKQLWNMYKTVTGATAGGSNIKIYNSAANLVTANASQKGNELAIQIDARVTSQLAKGNYNNALASGSNLSENGVYYPL